MRHSRFLLPVLLIAVATPCWSAAKSQRSISSVESWSDFKKEVFPSVHCAMSLISSPIQDSGFGSSVTVSYAGYRFTRTDIGDPDGELRILNPSGVQCVVPISLAQNVYLSVKDALLLVESYSGSSNFRSVFKLDGKCQPAKTYMISAESPSDAGAKELAEYRAWITNSSGDLPACSK